MPSTSSSTEPVQEIAALRRFLERGARPQKEHGLGVEHEKIGVLADGSAPTWDGPSGVGTLLERIAAGGRWQRVEETGRLIGLKRGRASVSLEPGGQFEFSDAPRLTARAAADALDEHLDELAEPARALGITWLAAGLRPFGTLDDVPWMPKGRYAVMRSYLPTRGARAHEMMKRTATVQANLDWIDEVDCAARVRTAMGVASLVTALWANSPIVDGKPSPYQSYRAAIWLETDPDRCGLLPFAFADPTEGRLLDDYVQWALDVPLFFVYRDGLYHPAGGITFRRFMAEGFGAERATLADWELHLSTLFPEVRLRPHIEVRAADAGTLPMVKALPALYRGILDDPEAREAAWAMVARWSLAEREQLRREVPTGGLRAMVGGRAVGEWCRELVALSRQGLARLGDDVSLLDPVIEVATTGRTPADRMLEAWHATGGDPARLIPALAL